MTVNVTKPALNIREKLAELDKPSGIAGEAMLRADSVQEQRNLIGAGRKNLIINGGFDVWQRGTSFTAGNYYHADRSLCYIDTRADSSLSRSTDVPATGHFKYSQKLTASQANGYPFYRQKIEDFSTWVNSTNSYVMSFWAKASVPMTIVSDLGDASPETHSLTTSWQRFTNIVPAGTTFSYTAFDIQENSAAGDIYITGVQLELGSVATDFEHRSYGEELALCQRYYYRYINTNTANKYYGAVVYYNSTNVRWHIKFPVSMRTTPSLDHTTGATHWSAYSSATGDDLISFALHSGNEESVTIYSGNGNGVAGQAGNVQANSAASYMAFDAEL